MSEGFGATGNDQSGVFTDFSLRFSGNPPNVQGVLSTVQPPPAVGSDLIMPSTRDSFREKKFSGHSIEEIKQAAGKHIKDAHGIEVDWKKGQA